MICTRFYCARLLRPGRLTCVSQVGREVATGRHTGSSAALATPRRSMSWWLVAFRPAASEGIAAEGVCRCRRTTDLGHQSDTQSISANAKARCDRAQSKFSIFAAKKLCPRGKSHLRHGSSSGDWGADRFGQASAHVFRSIATPRSSPIGRPAVGTGLKWNIQGSKQDRKEPPIGDCSDKFD